MIALSYIAFIAAVYCYTRSQKAQHSEDTSKNKYKQPLEPVDNWYSRLFSLSYKEKFPLSGSLLVVLTDAYHGWQFGFKVFLCVAIALYKPLFGVWDAGIYFVLFGVIFTISYRDKRVKTDQGKK